MTAMDLLPIIRVIHRAIREARDAGLGRSGQSQRAALEVLRQRPDIPVDEALSLVQRVHHGLHDS